VTFDGSAEVVLSGKRAGRGENGGIRADRVVVSFVPGTFIPGSAEARGNARLNLSSAAGQKSVVRTSEALLTFDADGELERWSASGGFRAEFEDNSAAGRSLEGESAAYEARARVLKVMGEPGRPAVADSSAFRVEAAAVAAGPGDRDLEASGGVKCLLKPGEERRAAGFFASAEPVSVSSASLVVRDNAGTFVFSGDVQAWQDKDFLLAGELELSEATRDMRARQGASVGLFQAAVGETPERRIEVGGEEMDFSASVRLLSFRGKAYVQLPGARLGAETVDAVLAGEGRGVDSFAARRNVIVSKGRYEGRGGSAFYQAEADRITLTGRPVLVDKEGGSSRGDKLTFDLGDGKIRVENEGQGRSTTVIKS
jgi:lipopolysaccharide export system protein LptA